MKFSHTLSLNSNPDWAAAGAYLDYAGLKKVINELEQDVQTSPQTRDTEQCRRIFLGKLQKQIVTIRDFYQHKRGELDVLLAQLQSTLALRTASSRTEPGSTFGDSEHPLSLPTTSHGHEQSPLLSTTSSLDLEDARRSICDLFVQYHSLKTYASLNSEAVRKVRAQKAVTHQRR